MCLAVPGRVEQVTGEGLSRSGRVRFDALAREVSLACVPEAGPGSWVLVHAGMAISVVNPDAVESFLAEMRTVLEGDDEVR